MKNAPFRFGFENRPLIAIGGVLLGTGVLAAFPSCSSDDSVAPKTGATTSTGSTASSTTSSTVGSGGGSTTGSTTSSTTGGGNGGSSGGSAGAGGSSGAGGSGGSGDGGVACNTAPGKALQFDGNAIDMMTGDLGMTDLPGGDTPRTIELWAKFLGTQSWMAEHTIIETGYGNGGNMVFGIDMSGDATTTAPVGPRQFGPYTNGFSDNNRNNPTGVIVPGIAQTGWFHLSWSYTGNHGTLSFTVDGVEYPVTTQAGQPTMAFTAGIVTLGASQSFGFPGWAGVMDEVRIWRVARTPAQILANMRVVLKPTEPGLAAYYRFSEGTGTTTNDESMTVSHQLATCTAMNTRCHAVNTASPMWVASDIPGTFTCAP